jgi:hypothetical protein
MYQHPFRRSHGTIHAALLLLPSGMVWFINDLFRSL